MKITPSSKINTQVWVVEKGILRSRTDRLVTEEPLEIRLVVGGAYRTIAITMRTPGNDFDLAAGFLYSEGIIYGREDIRRMNHCIDPGVEPTNRYNIVNVELTTDIFPELTTLERHFYTNSACGVCGKTSLESLRHRGYLVNQSDVKVAADILYTLPEKLRSRQSIFSSTGGLHAAGLFNVDGELIALQEDVGRHNALDKLIGAALLTDSLPFNNQIVIVSGRTSFELLQKSLIAGVPIICAISAPSSLAVALAQEFGITLIGFLRGEKFNIYSHLERIILPNIN